MRADFSESRALNIRGETRILLNRNAVDNICHEHLEYYALQSFEYFLKLYDFGIVEVGLNDINEDSFRTYIPNR